MQTTPRKTQSNIGKQGLTPLIEHEMLEAGKCS
jgi:hypothetical protein